MIIIGIFRGVVNMRFIIIIRETVPSIIVVGRMRECDFNFGQKCSFVF